MFHRTEAEVMSNWQGDVANPVVSICCIAYNHAAYIAQSINGLLMQQTDFPFEILIHDDASTDGTTKIVKQFAREYPAIIRTVIQKENQYSKQPIISPRFLFPLARGKYIAMCEGDDYWSSPEKLMSQCQGLEENAEINLSFHPVSRLNVGNSRSRSLGSLSRTERHVKSKEIILGGGGFCPTASILFRSSIIPDIRSCVENAPVSDKFIQIVASLNHGALFVPQAMAVYRADHQGAWTQRIKNSEMLRDYESRIRFPYRWLYANCADRLLPILRFSEADQYATIAKNYISIGDFESAKSTLTSSSMIFPKSRILSGLVRWAANGPIRLRIYVAIYPGIRSIYRYIRIYFMA